jgi:hypothetical protein
VNGHRQTAPACPFGANNRAESEPHSTIPAGRVVRQAANRPSATTVTLQRGGELAGTSFTECTMPETDEPLTVSKLNGTRPEDLPVQQVVKFDLVLKSQNREDHRLRVSSDL